MKFIIYFLYYLLQFTWGLPQNIIGFILFLKYKGSDRDFYNGALIRYHSENWGGISLGAFIIMNNARGLVQTNDTRIHEYGHTIQSLILGPFYLLVIGIPSFIWCNNKRFIEMRKKGISYFSFYPERWANYLGELTTKEKLSPDSH